MKKAVLLLSLMLIPFQAYAASEEGEDDRLPQFPKIHAPSPLPEASCTNVANPLAWAIGDWTSPTLQVHVAQNAWFLQGATNASGTKVQFDPCGVSLETDQDMVFEAVRGEDGGMWGALWTAKGKAIRLKLSQKKM